MVERRPLAQNASESVIHGQATPGNGDADTSIVDSCFADGADGTSDTSQVLKPLFGEQPREPEAPLVPDLPAQSHKPSWPQAAVGQFIGVGDFYPNSLSPSDLDWCSADSFSSFWNNYLQSGDAMGMLQGWPRGLESVDCVEAAIQLEAAKLPFDSQLGLQGAKPGALSIVTVATNGLPQLSGGPDPGMAPLRHTMPSVGNATRDILRDSLRVPLCQTPWQPLSLGSFPLGEQLDYLIDLYFSNFDQVRGSNIDLLGLDL
jgi:hypothetical protein